MNKIKFEQALEELEDIVKELENGETTLEKAMELFENGIKLSRICSEKLNQAEKRIKTLSSSSDEDAISSLTA